MSITGPEQGGEILRNLPQPLMHADLIGPDLGGSMPPLRRVLFSDEIPVHPAVYGADFLFTGEFVDAVDDRVSELTDQDLRVIIEEVDAATAEALLGSYQAVDGDIDIRVSPTRMTLEQGDSTISLDKSDPMIIEPQQMGYYPFSFLDRGKIGDYARKSDSGLIVWTPSNISYSTVGRGLGFYGRNFAIGVNQVGFEWLRNRRR